MRRLALTMAAALAAVPFAAPASAQVREGVSARALLPAALRLVDVDVPEEPHAPVRLYYATEADQRASLLADVLVGASPEDARAAMAELVRTTSGALGAPAGAPAGAVGDDELVAFARDNVFVALRSLSRSHDLAALARHASAAIAAARPGPPPTAASSAHVARDPQVGEAVPIVLSAPALAAHVTARGPGYARRTPSGWVLARTAEGPIDLAVVVVDELLRRR